MLHHPFLFKGKTNASSRSSKKNFLRRCRGDLCQVKSSQAIPSTHHKLFSLELHYSPFASCFPFPTSKMIFENLCLFFAPLPFVFFVCFCVLVCWIACFVAMAQENTKLCDFSNTNNNDFISTPIAPATSAESYEINAALLNLVMKEQFSCSPNEDVAFHLKLLLNCVICKRKNMWIMIFSN